MPLRSEFRVRFRERIGDRHGASEYLSRTPAQRDASRIPAPLPGRLDFGGRVPGVPLRFTPWSHPRRMRDSSSRSRPSARAAGVRQHLRAFHDPAHTVKVNVVNRLLLALLISLTALPARGVEHGAWEIWDDCQFESGKYFDGDSFHVKHGRYSTIVRLYFADAPETDDSYGTRIAEQAAYFRATRAAVLNAGAKAKELTGRFLAEPFRVITRRQIAPGASRGERYYAVGESGGRRLDATLVAAGLARVGGETAEYPDAAAAQRAVADLRALELQAAKARRGLWLRTGFVESMSDVLKRPMAQGPATQARKINLNSATAAELESLPGIGPKMAEQIIRARPLKDMAAFDALPGIGSKTIERLQGLVSF